MVGGGGFLVDNASVDLTINQSLVYDNEAVGSESNGLLTPGAGGAFYVHACATLHLTNDTLYENTAAANDGGGMFSNNCESSGGSVTFVNDTIDSNLGTGNGENLNLTFDLAVTLTNSIVAGGDGANCALNDFTSGGYNLEDDSTCSPNGTTDITGQSPDLGGLSDNGGSSDTLLPNAGSPAIGAIPSASCTVTVDQASTTGTPVRAAAAPSAQSSTERRRVGIHGDADDDLCEHRHGIGLERLPDPERRRRALQRAVPDHRPCRRAADQQRRHLRDQPDGDRRLHERDHNLRRSRHL